MSDITFFQLCDEGTPVDPPMEPFLSDGTSVDLFEGTSVDPPSLFEGTSVDPLSFFEGTSVDLPTADPSLSDGTSVDLLPPSTSEETEEALQSSPCYSSCKGSSDELIKYLGVPAPTTFQYLQVSINYIRMIHAGFRNTISQFRTLPSVCSASTSHSFGMTLSSW